MIKQKKEKNKTVIFIVTLTLLYMNVTSLLAEQLKCKKFDLICKSKKFTEETIEYQKEEFNSAKNQLNKSKNKIKDIIPKKNNVYK